MAVELLVGKPQVREAKRAIQACNDYLRMGSGRSLEKLCRVYAEAGPEKPPTRHLATLKIWSSRYGWQARTDVYDAEIEQRKNEAVEARRRQAMEKGFALDYERVTTLKKLTVFLLGQIFERDSAGRYINVWLQDVKQIGSGQSAERVDIERFNAPIIDQLRGLLDDLAKETGGRKQQAELDVNLAKRIDFFEVVNPEEENGE